MYQKNPGKERAHSHQPVSLIHAPATTVPVLDTGGEIHYVDPRGTTILNYNAGGVARMLRYLLLLLPLLSIPAGILLVSLTPFSDGVLAGLGLLLSAVGLYDFIQTKRAVLKNYPVSTRMRFMLESIRPEIRQYFLESEHDETPYSREQRALAHRCAKGIESCARSARCATSTRSATSGSSIQWCLHTSTMPTSASPWVVALRIGLPKLGAELLRHVLRRLDPIQNSYSGIDRL
ncbi:MAG: hypothetical protein U5R46_09280 [Gammaproteobacteria bacterium]|nr:hypothetical protein [Gammaproteobacteria bacterium]